MSHPISEVLETTMAKIRQMVDVSTVVGEPMTVGEVTLVSVTKVNIGFGTGGSDYAGKHPSVSGTNCFGGGSGAGITITPIGFLVIKGDTVRMLPVNDVPSTGLDRAIELLPELVDKVSAILQERKGKAETPAEDVE